MLHTTGSAAQLPEPNVGVWKGAIWKEEQEAAERKLSPRSLARAALPEPGLVLGGVCTGVEFRGSAHPFAPLIDSDEGADDKGSGGKGGAGEDAVPSPCAPLEGPRLFDLRRIGLREGRRGGTGCKDGRSPSSSSQSGASNPGDRLEGNRPDPCPT